MRLIKRVMAVCLCLLMSSAGLNSAFAQTDVSGNDIAVSGNDIAVSDESITTTEAEEVYTDAVPMEAGENPEHIESCIEGCTDEGCECRCHQQNLFERIMACTSVDEINAILVEVSEEELLALTDEENEQISAHIEALEPDPLPAVVIEESTDEPVPSEIIYPGASYTNVAPLGDPVVGGAE